MGRRVQFGIRGGSPGKQHTGCIVVGVYEGRKLSSSAMELDTASSRAISDVLRRGDLEGKLGTTLLLPDVPKVAAERVLLVGLGRERQFLEDSYCTALTSAIKTLRTTEAAEATICLHQIPVKGRD